MNKLTLIGGSGILGLAIGLMINGGAKPSIFVIAGAMSAFTGGLTMVVADTKNQQKINLIDSKLSDKNRENHKLSLLISTMSDEKAELSQKLGLLKQELEEVRVDLADKSLNESAKLSEVTRLNQLVSDFASKNSELEEEVSRLKDDIERMEECFQDACEDEANKRFQDALAAEIKKNRDDCVAILQEAFEVSQGYRQLTKDIYVRHQEQRENIFDINAQFNGHIDECQRSFADERNNYLNQIDLLHMKVAALQQKLAGDLLEPEYGQFGFDQGGRIANALAEWLWNHHKIPLKVTGFEVGDGVITAGYAYSRSMTPEALARVIEGESSQIARSLGLYAIEKPHKLQIADVFTVKIRRERPARKADKGSLYRSKEEFVGYVLSQPVRLRVIGEPGAGKTPTVAVLLSHIIKRGFLNANTPNGQKLPYCVAASCNPLLGISVKNSDELDFCLKWNEGKKGFRGLVEEYRFRKNLANTEYTKLVGYVWVADEVDNTMAELTKDEAKPFKDALKDGGHVNIGVIVMGQSANVSTSKGLSIDDQKMMTNIYIDPVSIRTFLTQYGERFYSKKAVEKALATLEELELEIEEQNEIICDTAREFRIAMVTANRSPVFYQLPYFDSVEIDREAYQKTLTEVAHIRATGQQHVATTDKPGAIQDKVIASQGAGAGATPTQVCCPRCASTVKRNGKTSTGVQKYLCKNADCKFGFTN